MSPLSVETTGTVTPVSGSRIRSYVLRAGRGTSAQRRSYDSLSGQFVIPFTNTVMNFSAVFGNNNPVIVEIGFGMGAATAIIAEENPEKNYLGVEVHKPGIGRLLWNIEEHALNNVRIVEYDAVQVLERMIPPRSLDGIHIFFPDPWPKKRHHKRRLVKRPFTDTLAAKLKPGGYVYFVTDWEDYARRALAELSATLGIVNMYDNFSPPMEWRPCTGFEKKGIAKNHEVKELFFRYHDECQ